ncbi:MAG: YicC family protein [Acidobacteria bacterium]|nr:YicC family protein [Acidobacteriota bacterium]
MTGFARVRRTLAAGDLVLSIKSVNHRGLDLHFRLAPDLDSFESALRSAVRRRVARGHLDIHAAWDRRASDGASGLNLPLLEAWLAAFREAAREGGISATPDLNAALRIPGMFGGPAPAEPSPEIERELVAAAEEALEMLNGFREREGAAIAQDIRRRCESISGLAAQIESIRSRAAAAFHARLKERLEELLRPAAIDPQRLAQEAALAVERSDISEELLRLQVHTRQAAELAASGGEIGKKLDFLLQEMNRETNTLLSKTAALGEIGLQITDLALAAKGEIDKIREQSLNLE